MADKTISKLNIPLEAIQRALEQGKSIEIHPCKDGIKVMEVSKRILKIERAEI